MSLLDAIKQNPFCLAPMAGITDRAFRSFMREMGCGVVVTELVSATGLKYSSEKTRKLMAFDEIQHPVGIQLFGEEITHLEEAAKEVEAKGADFVDLNFGCPVPKVVKKGAGSAILKDLNKVAEVFQKVRAATRLPVTVKIRTGWDEQSRNSKELTKIAYEEGLSWVAIHGRTRAQGYSGLANWDYIAEVAANSKIPIIGNGDITNAEMAVSRLRQSGCHGVMIGRGCLKNPWIFSEAQAILVSALGHAKIGASTARSKDKTFSIVFEKLVHHLEKDQNPKTMALQLKKFAAWFSTGYPNAGAFRKSLFASQTLDEIKEMILNYFGRVEALSQADTSAEPFLMGGHG